MDADPQETYPRIDPAIIVAVRNKDTLLMARNAQRPGFFSLIAGYVSVEETIEDTVSLWKKPDCAAIMCSTGVASLGATTPSCSAFLPTVMG